MRSLSATLLAAQKKSSRLPYLKVEVLDRVAGLARLWWSRLYTGSEADYHHAATMPGDGSLLRARVDPATYQLFLQRVTNPEPQSNFASWSGMGQVSDVSGVALGSEGATVLLFSVDSDQQTIAVRESTDYGATFASPVTVVAAPSPVGWLAADVKANGDAALFYSLSATIYVLLRTSGAWGSPIPWSNSASAITGLTCIHRGDWNLLVCGQDSHGDFQVWSCLYGDGYSLDPGLWSSLAEVSTASSGSNVEFRCPFLGFPGVFRAFFVEKYSGTVSYQRPLWTHSLSTAEFIENLWREPVPFDFSGSYGLALAYSASYVWLSSPSGVWRASLAPAIADITQDVIRLAAQVPGGLEMELRNDDGRFNALGSGAYAAIKLGSEVAVSPGYRTEIGVESSPGLSFWIRSWEHRSQGGKAILLVRGEDAWSLLREWKARRQFAWEAGVQSVFQILRFLFSRAGLELSSLSVSQTITDHSPAFTVHPSDSSLGAVERLLAMVPDVILFHNSRGYVKNPQGGDAVDYAYGTDHPLIEGRYGTSAAVINRVQVFGQGVFYDAPDWGEVSAMGPRLFQVHDLNLSTSAQTQDRGQTQLQKALRDTMGGEVTVPANCGQELYDVVEITDPRAGLSAARRRIEGIRLDYAATKPTVYRQRLFLARV
ncbi:MAG: hypothetical protein HYU86_08125 [Chloroflexi bacterium]|nr:hypothetical protein [Chloroflexota bacterium]